MPILNHLEQIAVRTFRAYCDFCSTSYGLPVTDGQLTLRPDNSNEIPGYMGQGKPYTTIPPTNRAMLESSMAADGWKLVELYGKETVVCVNCAKKAPGGAHA